MMAISMMMIMFSMMADYDNLYNGNDDGDGTND